MSFEVFMRRACSEGRKQFMSNLRSARRLWPNLLHRIQIKALESLSTRYSLSVPVGDLLLLDGRWYVTHAGLLHVAQLNRCAGIRVQQVRQFCDPVMGRWVFKATVYTSPRSKGFVGEDRRQGSGEQIRRRSERRKRKRPNLLLPSS